MSALVIMNGTKPETPEPLAWFLYREGAMVDTVLKQRKFGLAVFFTLTGTLALFIGKIGGGEWLGLVGLVLGLYSAANVAEKRNANG